jgi:SOS response regulatory protein OraA/RecX
VATVLFIKAVPSKKRIQIGILESGDEYTYTVTEATYKALGSPLRGCDLSVSELGTIRFEDEYIRALKKAADYLSVSDKSKFALKIKLLKAGFSAEASDMALTRLCELGYLDEERQLERAVEREANYNLRGRHYIKRKLASKGYSASSVGRAIDTLVERGEIDFNENFEHLAAKKGVSSDEDRLALAYKFGYKI